MTSVAGAFLTDSSSPCELQFEPDGLACVWLSGGAGAASQAIGQQQKKALRISYSDVIAIKRVLRPRNCDVSADDERAPPPLAATTKRATYCRKVRIYYAERKLHKSTGRLLKLKRLVVEQTQQQQKVLHAKVDSKFSFESNEFDKQQPTSSGDLPKEATRSASELSQLDEFYEKLSQFVQPTQVKRPKRLLVFVNPFGGKGNALNIYKSQVKRLFDLAGLENELVVTRYANHARDTIEDPQFDVEVFDGIVCIGGDGMFSELMNGLLFRSNRDKILATELSQLNKRAAALSNRSQQTRDERQQDVPIRVDGNNKKTFARFNGNCEDKSRISWINNSHSNEQAEDELSGGGGGNCADVSQLQVQLAELRSALGGIGQQLTTPTIPIGMIGAGSTDANVFGFIGTNDVISATLNILLGNQIQVDVCSVHSINDDRLLRFVSTFIAYGYFGDVVRESERLRWLGPTRYDVSGFQRLLKNQAYSGLVRIVRSLDDGTPRDTTRCHSNCKLCTCVEEEETETETETEPKRFEIVERRGAFMGVNAAVMACRCPKSKQGFSPGNHLANGCADLVLIRPCSRVQYLNYLIRVGLSKRSPFDLKFVEAYRCRQFEFFAQDSEGRCDGAGGHSRDDSGFDSLGSADRQTDGGSNSNSLDSKQSYSQGGGGSSTLESASSANSDVNDKSSMATPFSSWNADGEILNEQSIRVKVNRRLLRVFGTGEPQPKQLVHLPQHFS